MGAQSVASSAADGKTLLFAPDTVVTVNPFLYQKSSFDVGTLVPIGMVAVQSSVLVVRADSKVSSLREFVEGAKSKEVTYSSAGVGSSGHLVMSYFKGLGGFNAVHVTYKGGAPAVLAVVSGEVDSAYLGVGNVLPFIQQGKLKALAVSNAKRLPQLPNVPTMEEQGYKGFVVLNGNMLMAPRNTPAPVLHTLHGQLQKVSQSKTFQDSLEKLGLEVASLDPKQSAE